MRSIQLTLAVSCLISSLAVAQDYRGQVFGGYSYLNADFNNLASRQSFHGWEASASANVNRWFAAEWDGSGYYKKSDFGRLFGIPSLVGVNIHASDYTFAAGPRLNFQPAFVHVMFGFNHLIGSAAGVSASQDSLVGVFGGGVEWPSHTRIAVRGSADYAFTRHDIVNIGVPVTQNNVRAAAGVVFRFGSVGGAAPATKRTQPSVTSSTASSTSTLAIPQLGIRAATREDGGAEIIEVVPGSAADLAGLRREDVITSVDGKPIRSAMDLAAALSNQPTGAKVQIGYRIRGYWSSQATIITGQK